MSVVRGRRSWKGSPCARRDPLLQWQQGARGGGEVARNVDEENELCAWDVSQNLGEYNGRLSDT